LLVPVLALHLLCGPAVLAADITRGCYIANFSEESGQLKQVRLSIPENFVEQHMPAEEAPTMLLGATVSASRWGIRGPDIEDVGMGCSLEGERVVCSIDCDGGSASWESIGDDLILFTSTLAMATGHASLVMNPEPSGKSTSLHGTFVLREADPAQCLAASKSTPLLTELRPGDLTPLVQRTERALQDLGYFSGTPDWTFDDETARAVSDFQAALELPQTGEVDRVTQEKLTLYAVLEGGC
jgi:hypothetical protein